MRANTQVNKKRAAATKSKEEAKRRSLQAANGAVVTPQLFREAKRVNKHTKGRLCGNLSSLIPHLESITRVKSGNLCAWCGETSYYKCKLCGVGCHHDEKKGEHIGKQCFIHLHDDASYGLGWRDKYELFGGDKVALRTQWRSPTPDELKAHAAHIERISNPQTRYSLRSNVLFDSTDAENDNNNDGNN